MSDLKFSETIFEELECPICLDYYRTPIHLCSYGHSICNQCKERSRSCPQCRQPFAQNSRNISLERMLEQISKKCKFPGCTVEISLDKWHLHASTCELNPNLKCIECGSSEEQLISHLIRNHDYKEIIMEENEAIRSFSGPILSWRANTEWPKGIWRFGEEHLVVKAKTLSEVFHIYLYRTSKTLTAISLQIQNHENTANIKFQGDIPHISQYTESSTEPHFNCEIKQLMNFIRPQDDDLETHKLTVRVKKKAINVSDIY
jgi:hypothetical protein